ncbi:MAG TPA: mechanosensitive ion channel domain-containing protein [Puia sp.]|jgi:small-conductance mechanosensitive channel|nr:mechanosensitive ion channel domain-containing protein [Puia sp.]
MKYAAFFFMMLILAGNVMPVQGQRTKEETKAKNDKEKGKDNPPKSRLEYSLDTITGRLDNLHLTLNRINNFTTMGLNTRKVEEQLPQIGDNIQSIADNLSLSGTVPDFKSLQLYSVLLENIKEQLEGWRNSLFRYDIDLINMNNEINAFTHDTVIQQLIRDTAFRRMYLDEIIGLRAKWQRAGTATHSHLVRITNLQSVISNYYFQTIDLQNQVNVLRNELSGTIFNKEYNYLWEFRDSGVSGTGTGVLAARSYNGQRRIMGYFIRENWDDYVYVLLLGLLFFFWVWNNFRLIGKSPEPAKIIGATPLDYLRKYPVAASLVVMLSVIPFFDINAPAAYSHLIQLPLLITLSVMFAQRWPRRLFYYWLFLIVLYILFSATNLVLVPRMSVRYWLLLLQLISVIPGYMAIRRISRGVRLNRIVGIAAILYEICNILAILANAWGRLSLSRLFSTSAIFGLVQAVGLAVFVDCLMEAFSLQASASKLKQTGPTIPLFYSKAHRGIFRLLLVLSAFTWLVVFATNMDIFDPIYRVVGNWLNITRSVGSITFRLGNVVVFVVILYVSHVLQKYVGYLFGAPDDRTMPQEGKKGSRLVMMRLVLIIIGFFLAVIASGLPIDKITIVLGALGVGVGLGLQNIVNNLVSGIILIFESPFQIGDYIELNGKKGIVRDMGIRSSRLVTEEGTEIIMPNGDLLSGEVINWTVQNSKVRIEVPITVEAGPTLEEINAIVQETLKDHADLSSENKPKVLLSTANEKTLSFTIVVWVGNISQIQNLKSEILRLMYLKLKEKGIKTV